MRDEEGGPARGPRAARRGLVRGALAGLGGLAVAGGLPGAARAVPADPGAGPEVTPNPIVPRIPKSRVSVELADFSAPPPTSAAPQLALLNFVYHAGIGSGRLLAADSRGKIWDVDRATGVTTLFFDFAAARGAALVTAARYTLGLRSFAFHPDFARRGRPGFRKLYTVSTETAASHTGSAPLFTDTYPVDHHDVVAEWTTDATGRRVNVRSRRELLRVAMYLVDHNTDTLMFDPNAAPDSPAYGKMFVTVGDGGNVPRGPDPYNQAQNPLRALGKILRIDPIAAGGRPYAVPADNPFVGQSTHLPELWALGLRHPQNLCFDRGGAGAMILTDIGQAQI
jgi:hypothetical protein